MRIGKKKGILHIFHNVARNIYFDMLICAGAIFCSVGRGRRFRERRRGTVRDNFNVFNDHVNSYVSGSGVGVLQYSAKRKILGCVIPPRPGSLWPWAGCEFIQPSLHLLGEYCMLWLEAIKWRNVFGGGAGEWMTDPYPYAYVGGGGENGNRTDRSSLPKVFQSQNCLIIWRRWRWRR